MLSKKKLSWKEIQCQQNRLSWRPFPSLSIKIKIAILLHKGLKRSIFGINQSNPCLHYLLLAWGIDPMIYSAFSSLNQFEQPRLCHGALPFLEKHQKLIAYRKQISSPVQSRKLDHACPSAVLALVYKLALRLCLCLAYHAILGNCSTYEAHRWEEVKGKKVVLGYTDLYMPRL